MEIGKAKKLIILVVTSVFVLLAASYLLYIPKARHIHRLQRELREVYRQIEQIERMVARVPNPQEAIAELRQRQEKMKEKVSEREHIPRIVQQLVQNTKELDIEVISIRPLEQEAIRTYKTSQDLPEGVNKVYMEIRIRCSYRSLGSYIRGLNNLPLLLTIESLSIDKEAGAGKLLVHIILSAYILA
jgi:Tfp pilus assembly protein PilO